MRDVLQASRVFLTHNMEHRTTMQRHPKAPVGQVNSFPMSEHETAVVLKRIRREHPTSKIVLIDCRNADGSRAGTYIKEDRSILDALDPTSDRPAAPPPVRTIWHGRQMGLFVRGTHKRTVRRAPQPLVQA